MATLSTCEKQLSQGIFKVPFGSKSNSGIEKPRSKKKEEETKIGTNGPKS